LAITPAVILFVQAQPVHLTIWLAPEITLPYLGFRVIFQHRRAQEFFPAAIVGIGAVLALLGVYEALSKHNPFVAPAAQQMFAGRPVTTWDIPLYRAGLLRAASTFGHPIAFGMFLLIPLAFAITRRGWRYTAAMWLILAGEAATLSRGPWIGAVAVVLLLAHTSRRRTLGVGAVALIAVSFGPIHKLLSSGAGTQEAYNAHYRSQLLKQAFYHLSFAGNPNVALDRAIPNFSDVTSFVTVTALRTGVIGLLELAVLAALAISALVRARRTRDSDRAAGAAAFAGLLVGLLSVTLITNFQFFVWITVAYVATTYRRPAGEAPLPESASSQPGLQLALRHRTAPS
jgi:hypothetical protein